MEECKRISDLGENGRGKRRRDKGRSTVSLLWRIEKEMESDRQSRAVKNNVIRAERG
jgi:hypothetical protein